MDPITNLNDILSRVVQNVSAQVTQAQQIEKIHIRPEAVELERASKMPRKAVLILSQAAILKLIEEALQNPEASNEKFKDICELLIRNQGQKVISSLWIEHLTFDLLKASLRKYPHIVLLIEHLLQQLPKGGHEPTISPFIINNFSRWLTFAAHLIRFIAEPSPSVRVEQLFLALHDPQFQSNFNFLSFELIKTYPPPLEHGIMTAPLCTQLRQLQVSKEDAGQLDEIIGQWFVRGWIRDSELALPAVLNRCLRRDSKAWDLLTRLCFFADRTLLYQILNFLHEQLSNGKAFNSQLTMFLEGGLTDAINDHARKDWEEIAITWITTVPPILQKLKSQGALIPEAAVAIVNAIASLEPERLSCANSAASVLGVLTTLISLIGLGNNPLEKKLLGKMQALFEKGNCWNESYEQWVYFADFEKLWEIVQKQGWDTTACQSTTFVLDAFILEQKITISQSVLDGWYQKKAFTWPVMALIAIVAGHNALVEALEEKIAIYFNQDLQSPAHLDLISIFILSLKFGVVKQHLRIHLAKYLVGWNQCLEDGDEAIRRRGSLFSNHLINALPSLMEGTTYTATLQQGLEDLVLDFHLPEGERPSFDGSCLRIAHLAQLAIKFPLLFKATPIVYEEMFYMPPPEHLGGDAQQRLLDNLIQLQENEWLDTTDGQWAALIESFLGV